MTASRKKSDSASAGAWPGLPSAEDLGRLVEQFKLPGVDVSALVEWQRKDFEALVEANRQAVEGMKSLATRQGEILQETLAQWQGAIGSAAGTGGTGGAASGAESVQRGIGQALENVRELATLEAAARGKAWKVMQDRMQDNMANLQKLLQGR